MDERVRARLLERARRRTFGRGEVVLHAGDPANALHLLVSGHVSVGVSTPAGDTAVLAVLGPGSIFGELALLSPREERSATVAALEGAVTLSVAREHLSALRRDNPEVDALLLGLLADYVHRLDARLLEALYVPADRRVLRRLLALSRQYGDGSAGTTVPLTQDVLASMAGTTRPTANQALRAAQHEGLVTIERGRVRVDDPAGLARRARWR
ncbi:cyclic nucleotide-binding domain-containing protein [Kineococcus sp. T90]|nr:cyclic nucleotide-binding domain-containing protein [Kineococcus indalonis]